jgi:hypothetical protein
VDEAAAPTLHSHADPRLVEDARRWGAPTLARIAAVTLVDALKQLGPTVGDEEVDELRSLACSIVLAECQRLARMYPEAYRGDLVSDILARLIANGPRAARPVGPHTDEEARAFLWTALRYGSLSRHRRYAHEVALEPRHEAVASLQQAFDGALDAAKAAALLNWARTEFYDRIALEIARAIAPGRGGDDSFLTAVGQLREIADGRATFSTIQAREYGPGDPALAQRLYQQHCRARRRVLDWAKDHLDGLSVDEPRKRALALVICELQPRRERARSWLMTRLWKGRG